MSASLLAPVLALLAATIPLACVHGDGGDTAGRPSRPFLWSVTRGAGDGDHYLFGTIHAGVAAETELAPEVWAAFERSDCYVMETDQAAVDPVELARMAELPRGEVLSHKLTPAAWQVIESRLRDVVPRERLERSEPWFAALLLVQSMMPTGQGMDGVLLARARAAGKRIGFLEDWRDAIRAFASVTDLADLEQLALEENEAREDTARLVEAYRSGDEVELGRVSAQIQEGTPDADAKLEILLAGRNRAWLPELARHLAEGRCFVAVGAAHLVGDGSLRELLTESGYKVRRSAEDLP